MAKITTVFGNIAPEELGFTSMHDHTFLDMHVAGEFLKAMFPDATEEMLAFRPENYIHLKTGMYLASEELHLIDDLEGLTKEFNYFKADGGNSVVDPAPLGIRGDINKIRALSKATGLNIICATGIYHETATPEEYRGFSADEYYKLFMDEIENGIDGTDAHPGILKASFATISESEMNVLDGCLRAGSETGMVTYVHTEPMLDPDEVLEALNKTTAKYGLDHDRVSVCHMDNRIAGGVSVMDYLEDPGTDRTLDLTLSKLLLENGYNIGLDTWGMPVENPNYFMADDFERLKALITLMDMGYEDHITLGNDFSSKLSWRAYGGYGCTRFIDFGLSMLEMLGREDQIKKLVYDNPKRILAY